jgi:hypothetical protein
MKLISMTDFVLYQDNNDLSEYKIESIFNYANFLKQPLELWMFVPCDDDGNVLEYPVLKQNKRTVEENVAYQNKTFQYQQAKEICLFDDFEMDNSFVTHKSHSSFFYPKSLLHEKTIEDLVKYNLQLTPTALKQIGL